MDLDDSGSSAALASPPPRRLSVWRIVALVGVIAGLGVAGTWLVRYLQRPVVVPAETWYAPYVDATLTPYFPFEDPGVNPVSDVVLGFVVADGTDGCTPSWGGAYTLDEAATALDLDRRTARYREGSGDVIVSFGGFANDELAVACTDETALVAAYRAVIDRYELTTIDLDIEGDALADAASISRRARAIATVQADAHAAGRDLAVWLTLPVSPSGLLPDAAAVVDAMLAAEVDLGGVNVMTMNYGPSRGSETMAEASTEALRAVHRQLGSAYQRADIRLADTQIWGKLGATPMIGVNDEAQDVFDLEDAEELRTFAQERGLGRMSIWSANRDAPCGEGVDSSSVSNHCSGLEQTPGAFDAIFAELPGRPAAGAGRRTVPADVPVDDPTTSPYPLWDRGRVYEDGDKTVRMGNVYRAKWWTRGDDPDAPTDNVWETPWSLVGPVLPTDRPTPTVTVPDGTYPDWDQASIYVEGAEVMFDGVGYRAKWWTQGDQPGGPPDSSGQTPWRPIDPTSTADPAGTGTGPTR